MPRIDAGTARQGADPARQVGRARAATTTPAAEGALSATRLRALWPGLPCGLSQAYGTGHAGLGLAIAMAVAVFQPSMFAICAYAVALALLFWRRFEPARFVQGLYLFNPFLFGCFAFAAFGAGVQAVLAVSIAVPAICLLALWLDSIGWRAYFTAPYIAAAHASIIVLQRQLPPFPVIEPAHPGFVDGVITSFAQVLLSADYRVGLAVLIAGLVLRPLATVVAFAASALLSMAWLAAGLPEAAAAAGLVGYNAVILSYFVGRDLRTQAGGYLVALAGGAAAQWVFFTLDIAAYTFPFVVSGWIYLVWRARAREPVPQA